MRENRYSRQILLPEIGQQGQKALSGSVAIVVGCGALGTHSLSFLVRAGVGDVRVVDRDVVEESNLQRQTLFDERHIGRAKAKVAEEQLRNVNSRVKVTGQVADMTYANVQGIIRDATVVVDATDNMDTRFLLNDACVKLGIPWVYAGAVGTVGMVMPIVPDGPCLRCVFPSPPHPGELPTCDTVGIVNTLPAAIAAFAVTEAFKIILGKDLRVELLVLDIWQRDVQTVQVKKNPKCKCCGEGEYEFLQARKRKLVVSLCGRNAVQIVPSKPLKGDLMSLSRKLSKLGSVSTVDGLLRFKTRTEDMTIFPDGRTIVSGTTDLSKAKTIFSKYIGD